MGHTHQAWRPASGTKTGRVWEIADELEGRHGRLPRVSEVVAAYAAEGGHPGTGQVQYYAWKNARKGAPPAPAPAGPRPSRPDRSGWIEVAADGLLALPPDVLAAAGLEGGGRVRAQAVDGEIRLTCAPGWLAAAQALARRLDPSGTSWSEELIAERRAEAARE